MFALIVCEIATIGNQFTKNYLLLHYFIKTIFYLSNLLSIFISKLEYFFKKIILYIIFVNKSLFFIKKNVQRTK